MKRLLLLLYIFPLLASAQDNPLTIEGTAPAFYILHKVAAKENIYSIGRMFNTSPKEQIGPFNNIDISKPLSLGQIIKIPLIASNFTQDATAADDEALVPVYHTVQTKESLFHISATYNKVPLASLRKWNNINSDDLKEGSGFIIGYLKVKKAVSPLASGAVVPAKENEPGKPTETVKETPKTTPPTKTGVIVKPKQETVVTPVPEKKKEEQPEIKQPEQSNTNVATNNDFNGGVFKSDYNNAGNIIKETGMAGTFKSTSGWSNGKYYCLFNSASPGAIVKITNTSTGKSVYAKVLDVLPDIKQNNGTMVCMSNAAADALGAGDSTKFDCTIEYNK